MTKKQLIATAETLHQPPVQAAQEYEEKREKMAVRINQRLEQRADLETLIGPNNVEMMRDNHRNHARFIASLLASYSPEVLVETVLWVFRAYRSHGFQLTYWPAQLDAWVDVLREELTNASFDAIYPFYHWMIIHQAHFVALSDMPSVPSSRRD